MHTASHPRSLLQIAAQAWKDWREARGRIAELLACDSREIKDIARDVGVSSDTLVSLAAKRPDSADLLFQRMNVLHVDPSVVEVQEPTVMRDMQRCCSLCDSKARCGHDLDTRPKDRDWQDYCPNSQTLAALQAGRSGCCG